MSPLRRRRPAVLDMPPAPFLDDSLARVPASMTVGGLELQLAAVDWVQKIVMTGSIKSNLLEMFSLVGQGEMTVSATYSIPTVGGGSAPRS